ncbi:MAG: hypothetical protein CME60_05890 [Halobacteriovoraceae bacterium]|nr:hypothetical protein [Halobacteriovoraceae bacterium]|tara:strand:+ start:674 stop:1654 length:981 start_codon:yes stop_codon:yes gene_type:complete
MTSTSFNDDDFSLVILSNVNPERELPTDVYIHVDSKYIKFKSKGDQIGTEKYDYFLSKGMKNIYIPAEDIMTFLSWINDDLIEEESDFVKKAGEESRDFFKRGKDFKQKIYEVYFEDELNGKIVETLQDNVADFVDNIKKNEMTSKAIAFLMSKNSSVADHSLNVANLSIFIGMVMGHGHQFVLENLYMGGLFHDYGKLKIDPKVLENKENRMYSHAVQEHPMTGANLLRKTDGIPKQVLTIVEQHHEQFNGHGYPNSLQGDQIYDLAQIVSMANIFDNILIENKNFEKRQKYKKAIKVLEYDGGKHWNPRYMDRVVEALTLAYID